MYEYRKQVMDKAISHPPPINAQPVPKQWQPPFHPSSIPPSANSPQFYSFFA